MMDAPWQLQKDLEKKVCKAFQQLLDATHHSTDTLFDHFLEYVITGWAVNAAPLTWWKYTEEQNLLFKNLYETWVEALGELAKVSGWYDFLGILYENYVAGPLRKKGAGQFFTPMTICNLMAQLTTPSDTQEHGTVSDPCCGSGRLLLAAHAINPALTFDAKDLDRTCCMMTVCNFLVHGCRGTVTWGNSLLPDDRMEAWEVNALLGTDTPFGKIPHIERIDCAKKKASA